MKIGVQLPEVERVVRWPEIVEMARLIESLGFDSIWVGDHLLYEIDGVRRGPWEAWTQLAGIAAVTERVAIGPLVAAVPFHEPAMLAKMASTVDEISGGRLVFGVGAGWNELEFRAFGLPYQDRVGRFEEGFHLIRRLLAGERVDHRGRFYTLEGAELLPPPRTPGGPPLMVGSNGPRMLGITLPHVAAWNSWFESFGNDPERLPLLLTEIDRACERAGRDPGTLEKTVAMFVQFGEAAERRNALDPLTGPDERIAESLGAAFAAGVSHVQLVLDPITVSSIHRAAGVMRLLRGPLAG